MCSRTLLRMMNLVPSALLLAAPVVASAQFKPRVFTVKPAGAPASTNAAQIRGYLDGLPALVMVNPRAGQAQAMAGLPEGITGQQLVGQQVVNTQAELALLKSYPDVAWPGALVQGATINNNAFSPIGLPRAAGRIRLATEFTGANSGLSQSTDLPIMSATAVDDARRGLLQRLAPRGSTGMIFANYESAETLREALVKLAVAYEGSGLTASGDLHWNSAYNENTIVAKFTQVFYRVQFDPSDDSPFFGPSVTLDDVKRWASPGNPPLYVSEVKYGRILLVRFTGTMSKDTLAAAVKAAYSGFSGSAAAAYKSKFSSVRMEILSVGSRADQAVGLVNATTADGMMNALRAAIDKGSNYDPVNNPGDAIGITMRYVGSRTAAGPYQLAIAQMVTEASPQVIDLTTKQLCAPPVRFKGASAGPFLVWDGPGGGPVNTQIKVAPGDEVTFSASGTNWSGVFATGDYDPRGWYTWDRPKDNELGYPITDRPPFALIARFGEGNNNNGPDQSKDGYNRGTVKGTPSDWFLVGSSVNAVAGQVDTQTGRGRPGFGNIWLGTNDNNPLNGDANKKFQVIVCVKRNPYNPASAY